MAEYLWLATAHGDEVAIASGTLVACARPRPDGVTPIVACRSGAILVLTANSGDGVAFALDGKALRTPVLFLGAVAEFDGLALTDPATCSYLTGRPRLDGAVTHAVAFGADEIEGWEYFAVSGMRGPPVHPDAASRLDAALSLLDGVLDAERLAWFAARPGAHIAGVLDASLPLLPTRRIDELAARLMNDAALRTVLASAYPTDPWAQSALPALAEWVGHAGRRSPIRRRQIGTDFDCLGVQGVNGDYASLPHACNVRARRATKPHRGPAVLGTARNEGIYLVEWIAYHRLLGAESVFIYSNDNQDGSERLLGALADAGVIVWVDSELSGHVGTRSSRRTATRWAAGPICSAMTGCWSSTSTSFLFWTAPDLPDLPISARGMTGMAPTLSRSTGSSWRPKRPAIPLAFL